jgi:predicted ribosome quality control (RQC) complex YloA/Tae2 family protein
MGARVQRVTVGLVEGREIALLHIRSPGRTLHVVVVAHRGDGGCEVGVVDKEGRARLREAMVGAAKPGAARWSALADEAARRIEQDPAEELEARGARISEELGREAAGGRRDRLRRALARTIARVERRVEAVRGDLARAEEAHRIAGRARLFVAEAARAPRGATRLVAADWSSGEAREAELPLDPSRGAREQIDAMFKRARRLQDGARIGRERLADAERARDALSAIAAALGDAADDVLAELEARARTAAPRDFKLGPAVRASFAPVPAPGARAASRSRPAAAQARTPYRTFTATSGARILVGRGAADNDALTTRVARPHDLWLHAKGRHGAHVVVPLDRGASCPAELLVEAAHLAAHFSDARGEGIVEVQYVPRRHVRKARGSAPGLVLVDREKVMALRVQPALLRRLLEREDVI